MSERVDLDALDQSTRSAVTAARKDLANFMKLSAKWPPDQVRDGLIKVMQALVTQYGDLAATAAAEWYEQLRASQVGGSYTAVTAKPVPPAQVEASVRAAAGHLYKGAPDMALSVLSGALQRYVAGQSRNTIIRNTLRDPKARRFARVPQGKTCAWCSLLASRGFVYATAETAGAINRFHDDCDCRIVPGFDGDPPQIDGYDPDALYQDYIEAKAAAQQELGRTPTDREVAAQMRTMHPGKYKDGAGDGGRTSGSGKAWRKGKTAKPPSAGNGGKPPTPPRTSPAAQEPDDDRHRERRPGDLISGSAGERRNSRGALHDLALASWDDPSRGIRLKPGKGSVTVPDGANPEPHELATAETLSDHGLHVVFNPQVYGKGKKNPDATIDGDIWEFKAPDGSSEKNTISSQFKRAGKQAPRLVLDLRRCALDDGIAVQQAVRRFTGSVKINEMIVIDHDGAWCLMSI